MPEAFVFESVIYTFRLSNDHADATAVQHGDRERRARRDANPTRVHISELSVRFRFRAAPDDRSIV
jgi:hypothetical protein